MRIAVPPGVRAAAPLLALLLAASACGGAADGRYADTLLPLVPGATWDYRVRDAQGAPRARTLRVAGEEAGLLVLETRQDGTVRRSFLHGSPLVLAVREEARGPGGASIVRFDPGAPRALAPAAVRPGQVFLHRYFLDDGAAPREVEARWTVEAVGLTLVGDAGTFEGVVRVRREQSDGDAARLWYAPGVGLVRARGAEQLELVHWALP